MSPGNYQKLAIAHALEARAKFGIQVNRAYTPRAMMLTAEKLTGQKFKRGDYLAAAYALRNSMEVEHEQ
jgi:hypothetical protein